MRIIVNYIFLIILWGSATFETFTGQMSNVHYLLACMMLVLGGMMINLASSINETSDSFTHTIVWDGDDEDREWNDGKIN